MHLLGRRHTVFAFTISAQSHGSTLPPTTKCSLLSALPTPKKKSGDTCGMVCRPCSLLQARQAQGLRMGVHGPAHNHRRLAVKALNFPSEGGKNTPPA